MDQVTLRSFQGPDVQPPENQLWVEALAPLSAIRRMAVGVVVLDATMKRLSEPIPGTIGKTPRYFCPHLTDIELLADYRNLKPNLILFREHIDRRQAAAAANPVDGPAKLKKIGFSHKFFDQVEADRSIFEGVEIYYTGRE